MSDFNRITFVITTSDRIDLLKSTLSSFRKLFPAAWHLFDKRILHEDSGNTEIHACILRDHSESFDCIIMPEQKVGYSQALDNCLKFVKTEYVFTSEDDWSYYRNPQAINQSIKILDNHPEINQVWIRDPKDHNHPLSKTTYILSGVQVRAVSRGYLGAWNGFSLNPGLRRMSDLKHFFPNGLAEYGDEIDCARRTAQFDYKAVSLLDHAIRHSGWDRHTKNFKV